MKRPCLSDQLVRCLSRSLTLSLSFSLVMSSLLASGCDARSISTDPTAIPARASVTASEETPPPNYTMKLDGVQLVVDANAVVQASSEGSVVLRTSDSSQPMGSEWKIFDESQPCCQSYSYAEIDALYRAGTPVSSEAISGGPELSISWQRFGLLDKTLPRSRFLIVKHRGRGGLCAYELFEIVFPAPRG